ncbi:hypothetical protein FGU71_00850 [Erythrobacter insulae]|uniref:Uncharacterized protein n=1 Tax=Erythrobacter insulae TaxID=2584124 RepID=A0A547P8T4_9SPHN|nr:hypothetical protein [Erythrobacter insulae]TRD10555.1 hypothetical protein FGU71_00850 [Erythrobacter insulae]
MIIHPDIAALRSDTALQRRISDRMGRGKEQWQRSHVARVLARDLTEFGGGCALSQCPGLAAIMTAADSAVELTEMWIASALDAVRQEPLGEVPYQYRYSPGLANMQIMQSGRASLNLIVYERQTECKVRFPQSVLFADCECHEIILSGSALATRHQMDETSQDAASIITTRFNLNAGDCLSFTGRSQARQIVKVESVMAILRLTRLPQQAKPSREYRLPDGALLKSTSGDKTASQRLMGLAVLGALECCDPVIGETFRYSALNRDEAQDVRWEAVRHMLARDSRDGMALLVQIAADKGDQLCEPAEQLRGQLSLAHPELRQLCAGAE